MGIPFYGDAHIYGTFTKFILKEVVELYVLEIRYKKNSYGNTDLCNHYFYIFYPFQYSNGRNSEWSDNRDS